MYIINVSYSIFFKITDRKIKVNSLFLLTVFNDIFYKDLTRI